MEDCTNRKQYVTLLTSEIYVLSGQARPRRTGGRNHHLAGMKGDRVKRKVHRQFGFPRILAFPPDVQTNLRRKRSPNSVILIPRCPVSSALSFVSGDRDAGSVGRFTPNEISFVS